MARRRLSIATGLAVLATAAGQVQGPSFLPAAHAQEPGDPPDEEPSPDEQEPDEQEPDEQVPEAADPGDEEAPADDSGAEAEGDEAAEAAAAEEPEGQELAEEEGDAAEPSQPAREAQEAPTVASQPGATAPGAAPTPQNTLAAVRAVISNVAAIDASQISSATSLRDDLQLDSLSFLEILVDLGIRFGFDGAPARADFGSLGTVADLVRWVDAKRPR